ncbi:hypothetical protein [Plantibacter sp. YIM 135347]|uniref:hypothetical protein n=1 Tax=Plantibacter sp. YIM 135347 TaxID=3423919 RepID=UPI003D3285CF
MTGKGPRSSLFTRRQRPVRGEAHRKALARAAKNPVSEAARSVALKSLFSEHERLRRTDRVNPYDFGLEHLIDTWVPEAVAEATTAWEQDRDVSAFVTVGVFEPRLRAILKQNATVASDVTFESEVTDSTLTIEHTAGGPRAKVLFREDGFGELDSEPERVRSTSDNMRDGQRYTRLGIGTHLVRILAPRCPLALWRSGQHGRSRCPENDACASAVAMGRALQLG